MTELEIKKAIADIIAEIAPDEASKLSGIKDDLRIRDQVDLDSMDFLDIILEIRKRYKVNIPESDYMKLATMNGCVEYLFPRLKDF